MDLLRFSQLLSSRLCHDLIAPLGAIGNGLEILEDCTDPKTQKELLTITKESTETALRRLVFYRLVFGHSSSSQLKSPKEIGAFIRSYVEPLKINFTLSTEKDFSSLQYPLLGRCLCNLALVLSEVAPFGGELSVHFGKNHRLTLSGNLVEMRRDIKEALLHKTDPNQLTPHTIQAYIAGMLALSLSLHISIEEISRTTVTFGLSPLETFPIVEPLLF